LESSRPIQNPRIELRSMTLWEAASPKPAIRRHQRAMHREPS
jgi:hypothetical protein